MTALVRLTSATGVGGIETHVVIDAGNDDQQYPAKPAAPESGIRLDVQSTHPGLQVFTGTLFAGGTYCLRSVYAFSVDA